MCRWAFETRVQRNANSVSRKASGANVAKVFTGECLGSTSPFTVGRSGGEPIAEVTQRRLIEHCSAYSPFVEIKHMFVKSHVPGFLKCL